MPIKVRVRDFQSIVDETILIDRLTVVTGTNNAGKSAMFRAIRGVFTNAPGTDFVRIGRPHCTVDITFLDENTSITWEKGEGINNYVINGKRFNKVGRGVPPEVAAFGILPITANGTELWPQIASQITGVAFLLDQPGSVIAEAVADISRVNQLSRALKSCESDRKAARSSIKVLSETATRLGERRATFEGLDGLVTTMADLERRHTDGSQLARAVTNLSKLKERFDHSRAEVEALDGLTVVAQALPVDERVKEIERVAREWRDAQALRTRLEKAQATFESLVGLEVVEAAMSSERQVDTACKFRQGIGALASFSKRLQQAQGELDLAQEAQNAVAQVSLDDGPVQKLQKFSKALPTMRGLRARQTQLAEELSAATRARVVLEKEEQEVSAEALHLLGTLQECPTCGGHLDHVH